MSHVKLAAILVGFTVASIAAPAIAAESFSGTFASDKLTLTLVSSDGQSYTGTIRLGEKEFPVTARQADDRLAGTFASDGNRFDFDAVRSDAGLTLRTGTARHELKKLAANPLAKAGAPATNPAGGAKDPLAYKVHELPGGTIATFDNWKIVPVAADASLIIYDTHPAGREKDYVLRVCVGTPDAQVLANLFVVGPQFTRQFLQQVSPTFKLVGESKKTTVGGDEAMLEAYEATIQGKKVEARVLYVRRKDVAMAIAGFGNEAGFAEFGRSIEIVAQSITFKESAIEPQLVGTWTLENYHRVESATPGDVIGVGTSRSITIYPNSTFTDSAGTTVSGPTITGVAQGGNRGRVVKRGNVLTFHYDDGKTWSVDYQLRNGGIVLGGKIYLK